MPSSNGTFGSPSIASDGIQEMAVTVFSMRIGAPYALRNDFDSVTVGEQVVAADALALEARRRAPHPRAPTALGELMVDRVRHVQDAYRRVEGDRLLVAQEDPHQPREAPDRLAERVEARV